MELLELIASINSRYYAIYEHIRRCYPQHMPNYNIKHARGYASIVRHHVLNAHTYATMGKQEQCLTELRSAYVILEQHQLPRRNKHSEELVDLFKLAMCLLQTSENN